jgi:hypothetical protein
LRERGKVQLIEAEQLLRLLDDSWSLLLQGPPVALPLRKPVLAGRLVALSFTA